MPTENPRPKKGQKNIDCKHYLECLAYTARENWRTFNCESCDLFKVGPKEKLKATDMENKKLCKKCDERETIHPNSPYCSPCLHEMKKDKTAKQKTAEKNTHKAAGTPGNKKKVNDKRKPGKPQKTANTAITIEFGKNAHILNGIEKLADKEMRPINLQILFILREYLNGIQSSKHGRFNKNEQTGLILKKKASPLSPIIQNTRLP